MEDTVDVTIPVDAPMAAELKQPGAREAMGRLVSDALRAGRVNELAGAIAAVQAEARAAGLTDDEIDAELAAHKAERRARRSTG